jgi:chorismate mutase/prephenate dehydratase
VAYVHRPRIAYPGAAGSYTQEASAVLYPDADLYSAGTFEDVAEHVRRGDAAAGVLPIENSLAGLVVETWDLLAEGDLPIGGEAVMHIPHCLAGVPGADVAGVTRIHSHPVALQQCRKFLNGRFDRIATSTTSDAVRAVADAGDPTQAAIASPGAASRYGLEVLLDEISDHPENFTRFVAISRGPVRPYVPGLPWRTALRVVTNHRPGALHEAIEPLRYHGVNMVSLHSRPIPGEPWRYQFSIDIDGHRDEETVLRALHDVERRSARVVVLGVYPTTTRSDD